MSESNGPRKPRADHGTEDATQRAGRRRRVLFNLGVPFVDPDDILNRTEDVVALAYSVLEGVTEELRAGYHDAVRFNQDRRDGKNPSVPWKQLVDRAARLQGITFDAVGEGLGIARDAAESATRSVKRVVDTFEASRADVDAPPTLAGPVFEDVVRIDATPGSEPKAVTRKIRHAGLTRLRIVAQVPPLKRIDGSGRLAEGQDAAQLPVQSVTFMPTSETEEQFSQLAVVIGKIAADQKSGMYEGLITAKNFSLLIARLRVCVDPSYKVGDAASTKKAR